MKIFHGVLLAFCLLFGGSSTTSKAKPNGMGAFVTAILAGAVLKMVIDNNNVRDALKRVGITPGEATVSTVTLGTFAALGFLGVEQAAYVAKWEVVGIVLAKIILSYPAQYILHNVPLIGDTIVPQVELKRERSDAEKASRFTLALVSMASLPTAQYLIAYCVGWLRKHDMQLAK